MDLIIKEKNKIRAKKRRLKNEKKWIPLRIVSLITLIIFIVSFLIGIFGVAYGEYSKTGICGLIFAISLIVFVITRALLSNFTSHWIMDRLNERLWIKDGILYHFIQTSFAAGINSRSADEKAYLFAMNINSIREAKVDEKSGRIEFRADGRGRHYSDYLNEIVDKEWTLSNFPAVFYDYSEPSLRKTLEQEGVKFQAETLNFKIRDNRI